jgi:N-acetylmuramoyl-L-alanine amidase
MKTVVISAGHGGSDPGAMGNGLREKDLTLEVSLRCAEYLNREYPGNRIVLARDKDISLSLPARRDLVQKLGKVDLYVAVHFNAFNVESANGFETFTHDGPLYDITLNYQSVLHADIYGLMKSLGVNDRGRKRFNHYETRVMPCPTVIVEYLFITNRREADIARQIGNLQLMGQYTALGIARALDLKSGSQPAQPVEPPAEETKMPFWAEQVLRNKQVFIDLGKQLERGSE